VLFVVGVLLGGVCGDAGFRIAITESFLQSLRVYLPFTIDPMLAALQFPLASKSIVGENFEVNITNIVISKMQMLPPFMPQFTNHSSIIVSAPYRSNDLTFLLHWKNTSSSGTFQGVASFRNNNEMELQFSSNNGQMQIDIQNFQISALTMDTGDLSSLPPEIQNATNMFFNDADTLAASLRDSLQNIINGVTSWLNGTLTIPLPIIPLNVTFDYRLSQPPQIIPKDRIVLDFNGYFSMSDESKVCTTAGLPPLETNASYGVEIYFSKGHLDCLMDDIQSLPFKDIMSTILDNRMTMDMLFNGLDLYFSSPESSTYTWMNLVSSFQIIFHSGPKNDLIMKLNHYSSIAIQAGLNITDDTNPSLILSAHFRQANISASDFDNVAPRYKKQFADQESMNALVNGLLPQGYTYLIDPNLWSSAKNAVDENSIGFDTESDYLRFRLNSKT